MSKDDVAELMVRLEALIRQELLTMKEELRSMVREELENVLVEVRKDQQDNVKQVRDAVIRHALGLLSMVGKDDEGLRAWLDRREKKD